MHPGKRIYPVSEKNSGFIQSDLVPGCYYKLPEAHHGAWAYITPDNYPGRIMPENAKENPDGTLTVDCSIGENGIWSLKNGQWELTKDVKTV